MACRMWLCLNPSLVLFDLRAKEKTSVNSLVNTSFWQFSKFTFILILGQQSEDRRNHGLQIRMEAVWLGAQGY